MKSFLKHWLWLPILIGIIALLWVFGGWRSILPLFGWQIQPDSPAIQYKIKTSEIFNEWKSIIKDYEASPTYTNAEKTYDSLNNLLSEWQSIKALDGYEEYHAWILQAIEYDAKAFAVITGKATSGSTTIRDAAIQLWEQKDDALKKALEVAPK